MYKEVWSNFKKIDDSNAQVFNSLEELYAHYVKVLFGLNKDKTIISVYCGYYKVAEYRKIGD